MCWGTTLNKRNKATEHEHLSLSASCQWMQCDHLPQAGMRCQVIENMFLQCNIFIIFKIKLRKIKLKIWHHANLFNIPFILISNVCVWANSGNCRTYLEIETSSKSFSVCPTYTLSHTSWKLTESRGNTAHACDRGHRAQSCQWRVKEKRSQAQRRFWHCGLVLRWKLDQSFFSLLWWNTWQNPLMEGGDTAHQGDKSTVGRKGYSTWWQIKVISSVKQLGTLHPHPRNRERGRGSNGAQLIFFLFT